MLWTELMDKLFYKIGDVAEMLGIPCSTLRYWEKQFDMLSPSRAPKGHRRYTPADVEKIRKLYYLVKEKGYKIEAARDELQKNPDVIDYKFRAVERLRTLKAHLQDLIATMDKLR